MTQFITTKISQSNRKNININELTANDFGRYTTDYFLTVDYKNGKWQTPEIKGVENLVFSPFLSALHYGQSIFEGMKAYALPNKKIGVFRIEDHSQRLNRSAKRMAMPEVPSEIFIEGIKQLLKLDQDWLPTSVGGAIYIRPFLFATDECLVAKASLTYRFIVMLSPVGLYYSKPLKVCVETKYTRASIGGTGFAKAGGNYAASFYPTIQTIQKGFDQLLWMDSNTHEYIQEMGASNIMFVIDDTIVTPSLEDETILDGITRKTIIHLLKHSGKKVIEKKLSIHEILDAFKANKLKEAFGVGTAATVSPISQITYKDLDMFPSDTNNTIAEWIKMRLNSIRYGQEPDHFAWLTVID